MNSETRQFQPTLSMLNNQNDSLWMDGLRKGIWPKPTLFWIVAVYMALLIVRPWEKLIPELADIRFERVMVLFVAASVALNRGVSVKLNFQNIAMILVLMAICVSGLNAYDTELASAEVTEFIGLGLSFFFIQKAVRTPYQLFFIVACYFVATSLYVFKSEWEYVFHNAAKFEMGVKRLAGIDFSHGHPNSFGATMLCSLPIALFFHRARDLFCQTWPGRLRKLFQWLLPLYGLAAIAGIVLTRSRASTFGLLVFVALLVFRKQGLAAKAKWSAAFAVIVLTSFFLAPDDIRLRIQSTWDAGVEHRGAFVQGGANASAEGRKEGLLAGIEIFKRFPLTGVGVGNFADYRAEFVDGVALNAHNLPGELMGETGIVGSLAFLLFFIAMWLNSRRLLKLGQSYAQMTGNAVYLLLGIALFDALILLLYCGTTCHNLQQYQWYWYASFVVLALGFLRTELAQTRESTTSEMTDDLPPEEWSTGA